MSFFQNKTDKNWKKGQQLKDCTDHRALYARGLVAQSIDSKIQKNAPTTEHFMLGDWSPSL